MKRALNSNRKSQTLLFIAHLAFSNPPRVRHYRSSTLQTALRLSSCLKNEKSEHIRNVPSHDNIVSSKNAFGATNLADCSQEVRQSRDA